MVAAGCATYVPVNEPLACWSPGDGYREVPSCDPGRSGELLVILALSGGGMRAAVFSYGVRMPGPGPRGPQAPGGRAQ